MRRRKTAHPAITAKVMVVVIDKIDRTIARSVRAKPDLEAIDRYADMYRDKEKLPPVDVFTWTGPDARFLLAEGEHRVSARIAAGYTDVKAAVRQCKTRGEADRLARKMAYGANIKHGVPRSNADKRAAVTAAVTHPENEKISNRAIADLTQTSHTYVAEVREELGLSLPTRKVRGSADQAGNSGENAANPPDRPHPCDHPPTPAGVATLPPGGVSGCEENPPPTAPTTPVSSTTTRPPTAQKSVPEVRLGECRGHVQLIESAANKLRFQVRELTRSDHSAGGLGRVLRDAAFAFVVPLFNEPKTHPISGEPVEAWDWPAIDQICELVAAIGAALAEAEVRAGSTNPDAAVDHAA